MGDDSARTEPSIGKNHGEDRHPRCIYVVLSPAAPGAMSRASRRRPWRCSRGFICWSLCGSPLNNNLKALNSHH